MWKLVLTTFVSVFVAELGDKTQLATMMFSAEAKSPWPVFIGAASALVLSSLIGVFVGDALTKVVPAHYIQTGAGVLFVIIGVLLLFGKA